MSPRALRATVGAAVSLSLVLTGLVAASAANAADPDLAQYGAITATASQNDMDGNYPAENAIDGDGTTRWASGNGPDDAAAVFTASLTSDLGSVATVSGVSIAWEASYATAFDVQVATTEPDVDASWTTVASRTDSVGGTDAITLDAPVQARYVRLAMLERGAATWEAPVLHYYGYSVFSFEVNGTLAVPAVNVGSATVRAGAGSDVAIPLSLTGPVDSDQSVTVTSTDGTAIAGTDYEAVDEVVTFAAGETTAEFTVPTVSAGALAPAKAFTLTLSDPTEGITIGSRSATTVTLTPTGSFPNDGEATVLHDFEDGVPAGLFTWAARPEVTPALATAPDDAIPGASIDNDVLTATVAGPTQQEDWFGFSNDTAAQDWSGSDGFSFWFLAPAEAARSPMR